MGSLQHPNPDVVDNLVVQRDTSELIIKIMNEFAVIGDYDVAIPHVLKILSQAIHADRIFLLEQGRRLDSKVFEFCAEGVSPRMKAIKQVSDAALAKFVNHFVGCGIIFADSLDKLGVLNERELAFLRAQGVESELVAPLRENGRFVACLGADNYTLAEGIDIVRLFESISPFMATVVSNNQMLEELEWSGMHDTLTGLLNRRGIDAALKEYLEDRPGAPYALALIDIDDFKLTNDLYGHAAGDEALRLVARKMEELFPKGSLLARNGGDELLVMLLDDDAAQADELIGNFSSCDLRFDFDGSTVKLTTSIGYVSYPDQTDSQTDLYKRADAALYAVKLAGKAHAMRYSDDLGLQYRSQLGFTPRDIAENIPGAIMVREIAEPGKVLFVNSEMIEMLECESLEDYMDFTGAVYYSMIFSEDHGHVSSVSKRGLSSATAGTQYFVDYRVQTKSGNLKYVTEKCRVVEAEGSGMVIYGLVVELGEA